MADGYRMGIVLRPLRAAALLLLAGLLLISTGPSVGGWRATVVPGGSTPPAVRAGDVVIAGPPVPACARRLAADLPHGPVRLRIPMIGLPVVWVRERRAVPLLGMAAVLALLFTPRGSAAGAGLWRRRAPPTSPRGRRRRT
ncbi:MAG: hypothetical protein V7603_4096 [Micromonosporaceae bacterium]